MNINKIVTVDYKMRDMIIESIRCFTNVIGGLIKVIGPVLTADLSLSAFKIYYF